MTTVTETTVYPQQPGYTQSYPEQGYPQQGYPQQGYPQQEPYPGYPPQPAAGYPAQTTTYVQVQPAPASYPQYPQQHTYVTEKTQIVEHHHHHGACGRCGKGGMVEEYTCCGICLAVVFFPIGILCCLGMKEYRCTSCGHVI